MASSGSWTRPNGKSQEWISNEVAKIGRSVPPSVRRLSTFGIRRDAVGQGLAGARSAGRVRRAKLHDTQSTSRRPKLVGGIRLPSDVCPPSGPLLHLRPPLRPPSGPFPPPFA